MIAAGGAARQNEVRVANPKGSNPTQPGGQRGPRVSVVVEPLAERSDDDTIRDLRRHGASEIDHLAPGFISAVVAQDALKALGQVARVQVKAVQQSRPAATGRRPKSQ